MAVNFSDLPSTTTPINASNLNKIQNDLKSEVFIGKTRLTDCNDATTPGVYQYVGTTANIPAKAMPYGNLIVTFAGPASGGESYLIQLAIGSGQTVGTPYTCAKRTKSTSQGTWTDWTYFGEYDSGWVTPTLGSNFEVYSSGYTFRYRKMGEKIYIQGAVKPKANIATDATTTNRAVFTLPANYRPAYTMAFICKGAGKNVFNCSINPSNGIVTVDQYGTSSNITIPAGAMIMINIEFVQN